MKFTEEKLEQAVIKLFEAEGYKYLTVMDSAVSGGDMNEKKG